MKGRTWGEEVIPVELVVKGKKEIARPTNIRGEGMAIVRALELAKRLPCPKVRIITDSQFWIDMLRRHIPDWIERGSVWSSHKNPDITQTLWTLYSALGDKVELVFVNAWHGRERPEEGTSERYMYDGNRMAEETAEHVLGL